MGRMAEIYGFVAWLLGASLSSFRCQLIKTSVSSWFKVSGIKRMV